MVRDVPLSDIVDNPFQPRQDFNAETLRSLADEIAAGGFWNGSLQGRRNARGKVELVYGHRRLRALKLLKHSSVRIEIVDLSDSQMALRALEENLQREGLTDFERADAVKQAVDLERKRRKEANEPERGAMESVALRLGLDQGWVSKLCEISMSIDIEEREQIDGAITGKTAVEAKKWGGKPYVKTLVRQAKEAKKPGAKVTKPTENTVAAMKRSVAAAPESIQEKLKEEIIEGKLVRPDQVETRARRLASNHVKNHDKAPPDLKIVITGWTHDLRDWNTKLKTVAPYMDYVDEVPSIANGFRQALEQLIETAKDILKSART